MPNAPFIWGNGPGASNLTNIITAGSGDGTSAPSASVIKGPDATGTSVAGVNLTIQPGNGTGLGGSGAVIIQTAPAASSSPPSVGSINQTSTASGTTLTLTGYTVASTSDRLLVVAVSVQNNTAISSVQYGATSLTLLDSQLGAASTTFTAIYYLVAPTVGSANLVVTTGATTQIVLQAYVVSGVNQSVPFGVVSKTSGSATSASLTPASAVGDTVIDVISGGAAATVSGGQTLIQNGTTGAGVLASEASKAGAAGTTTMSYTFGGTTNFAYLAVAVKPTANTTANTMTEFLRVASSGAIGLSGANYGTSGQVLTSQGSSAAPSWTTAGTQLLAVSTKTTTYSATTSDSYLLLDATSAGFTTTLPTAVGNTGKIFYLKKTDSSVNVATIATTSSQTINGSTTFRLCTQNEQVNIVSDGSNWQIIGRVIPSIWTNYTPSISGFGTVTSVQMYYRRVGDSVEVQGSFVTGTPTAAQGTVPLPLSGTIASGKLGANYSVVGQAATNQDLTTMLNQYWIAIGGGSGAIYSRRQATNSDTPLSPQNASSIIGASTNVSVTFKVPVTNWEG